VTFDHHSPSDERPYTACCLLLQGTLARSDTVDEAIRNIRTAIEAYFEPVGATRCSDVGKHSASSSVASVQFACVV